MIWQSNETQGIAILDDQIVEYLKTYLDKKEAALSSQIKEAIHLDRNTSSLLEGEVLFSNRINDAVEELGKKVHLLGQMKEPKAISPTSAVAAKQINVALWNYVEALEGCVIELYQQIDQIGFEHWDLKMSRTVTAVKDELTHRMEDLVWTIRRLEQQLKKYRIIESRYQNKLKAIAVTCFFWRRLLDRSLESTLLKCQKFLNFRYGKFIDRYMGCVQLYEAAETSLQKFRSYKSITLENPDLIGKFEKLFHLLILWELNQTAHTLPKREPIRALRRLTTQENALTLFHEYLHAIRSALFEQSRRIKRLPQTEGDDSEILYGINEEVEGFKSELQMLKETMNRYKKFINQIETLKNNRRTFFGLLTKDASHNVKRLRLMGNEAEQLNKFAGEFQVSLQSNKILERRLTPQVENEINSYLHEMGHPLVSRDLMRRQSKILLNRLNSLDEMGALHQDVVEYNCSILCRAMVLDWKYHALLDIPLFMRIYEIHQNIVGVNDDQEHQNRLNKFRKLIKKLQQWIATRNTFENVENVELDINDIKAYFQDFLAQVQRLEQIDDPMDRKVFNQGITKARQSFLEYLYLFGSFFHQLSPNEPEEWLIRTQLLFVDQYFEAIENKLRELSANDNFARQ